jgi:hypothetical protein
MKIFSQTFAKKQKVSLLSFSILLTSIILTSFNIWGCYSFRNGVYSDTTNPLHNLSQIAGESSNIIISKHNKELNIDEFLTIVIGVPINILAFGFIFTSNYILLSMLIKHRQD